MKQLFLSALLCLITASSFVRAQNFDSKPVLEFKDKKEWPFFTIGARFMADAAYYNTDFTQLKSGAAITDARIRTSMSYNDWYFYADFDFSKGKFSQKNIFLQYAFNNGKSGFLKVGYYNDPSTMANNTSRGSLHFISRAASVNALSAGRQLGITYKYYNDRFFCYQGVFAENKYNDQTYGSQGITLGGRWLYMPVNSDFRTFHAGTALRYALINTNVMEDGVKKSCLNFGSSTQTYVDPFQFTNIELPWAKDELNVGIEALYRCKKQFLRGEYMLKCVKREISSQALSNTSGDWHATNSFHGGYIEWGYQLFGNGYKYDNKEGVLKGFDGKSFELVARYNYLNLNSIKNNESGIRRSDMASTSSDGGMEDTEIVSNSIRGGYMHSFTIGTNYSFIKYTQFLIEYTYNRINREKYHNDRNVHIVQARLIYSF